MKEEAIEILVDIFDMQTNIIIIFVSTSIKDIKTVYSKSLFS